MNTRLGVAASTLVLGLLSAAGPLLLASVPANAQAVPVLAVQSTSPAGQGDYLHAASNREVEFRPDNDPQADPVDLPRLVLLRDGVLTSDPDERTLIVGVRDAAVAAPDGVVTATLTVRTQHRDPDQGGALGRAPFITVLTDTQVLTGAASTGGDVVATVEFSATFGATVTVISGTTPAAIAMPTDYFWVDLELNGQSYFADNDYAFLMEHQYGVDLGTDQADMCSIT